MRKRRCDSQTHPLSSCIFIAAGLFSPWWCWSLLVTHSLAPVWLSCWRRLGSDWLTSRTANGRRTYRHSRRAFSWKLGLPSKFAWGKASLLEACQRQQLTFDWTGNAHLLSQTRTSSRWVCAHGCVWISAPHVIKNRHLSVSNGEKKANIAYNCFSIF